MIRFYGAEPEKIKKVKTEKKTTNLSVDRQTPKSTFGGRKKRTMGKHIKDWDKPFNSSRDFDVLELQFEFLPEYIEQNYPKGISKDRGRVTTEIALFLNWIKKKLKTGG